MNTFLISDTHFGHGNILTFKRNDGSMLRNFPTIEDHDEFLIKQWNSVVRPKDKVYHLGDVGFRNWTSLSEVLDRLNGEKVLIKGNHDGFKPTQYLKYFKDIRGSHILEKYILTHIPIHPESICRWKANIHGHTHYNSYEDQRYINVSVERLDDYKPVSFEEVRSRYE